MAEYYIFASGGAGIKTAIAVVLLAAAGYTPFKRQEAANRGILARRGPERDYDHSITIIPCDIDINSAQRERLIMLQKQQNYLRTVYDNGKMLRINIADSIRFSDDDETDGVSLNKIVGEHSDNPLMQSLFDPSQREKPNNDGTEGDMQLGCFFTSSFIQDRDLTGLFKGNPNEDRYIAFTGSVYGGTGASVTPTIYRLVKNFFNNHAAGGSMSPQFAGTNTQGCILMLPYFSISADSSNIAVESPEHTPRTKAALGKISQLAPDYTALVGAEQRQMKIGEGEKDEAVVAKGNRDQLNPLMPEDIAAAAAVFDFFARSHRNNEQVYIDAVNSNFGALPDGKELALCIRRLDYFLKLLKFYHVYKEGNSELTSFSGFYRPNGDENYLSIIGHYVYIGVESHKNRNNLLNALQEVEWNCPTNDTTEAIRCSFQNVNKVTDIVADKADKRCIDKIYRSMFKLKGGETDEFVRTLWQEVCKVLDS